MTKKITERNLRVFRDTLATLPELTPDQLELLRHIGETGGTPLRDVAARGGYGPLFASGYVETRSWDTTDLVHITVTGQGRLGLHDAIAQCEAVLAAEAARELDRHNAALARQAEQEARGRQEAAVAAKARQDRFAQRQEREHLVANRKARMAAANAAWRDRKARIEIQAAERRAKDVERVQRLSAALDALAARVAVLETPSFERIAFASNASALEPLDNAEAETLPDGTLTVKKFP